MTKRSQRVEVVQETLFLASLFLASLLASWSLGCSADQGDVRGEQIGALCAQTKGVEIELLNDFATAPNMGLVPFYAYDDNSLDRNNPDHLSTELTRDLNFFSPALTSDLDDPATWDPLAFCVTPGRNPPADPSLPANASALRFRGPISLLGSVDPADPREPDPEVKGVSGFVNWGAGFSGGWSPGLTALEDQMKDHRRDPTKDPPSVDQAPYTSSEDRTRHGKDASGWDGLAFWARLADEGATQLQVGVHDVHTFRGSRLNFLWPVLTAGATTIDGKEPFCREPDYIDPDGSASDQTEYRKQCGDGFMRTLELTSQWRFYRIPFSELRQNGWGAVAPRLATDEIYIVFFGATPNQPLDIMIDNISFYR